MAGKTMKKPANVAKLSKKSNERWNSQGGAMATIRDYLRNGARVSAVRYTGCDYACVKSFCPAVKMVGNNLTVNGRVLRTGDYVVRDASGGFTAMAAAAFEANYAPVYGC